MNEKAPETLLTVSLTDSEREHPQCSVMEPICLAQPGTVRGQCSSFPWGRFWEHRRDERVVLAEFTSCEKFSHPSLRDGPPRARALKGVLQKLDAGQRTMSS